MCGIAGILNFSTPPSEQIVREMAVAIDHRGPDDGGPNDANIAHNH